MTRPTQAGIFYREYEGKKPLYATYMCRIKVGVPMELAINPNTNKSTGRKPGTMSPMKEKIPPEERQKIESLENYRRKMQAITKESAKLQITNRIIGDLDDYYAK